jgi:hypothetical protein
MNDPVVTVWRNRIPYRCTLTYWGRKWETRPGVNKRLVNLRRMHQWVVHAPINGGEVLNLDTRDTPGWHIFECYHADGSPLVLNGPASPQES